MGNDKGFWIPLAVGAGLGLLKQREEAKAIKKQNEAAAAQTEFSPLTGMGPGQIQRAPSPWEGMMQGAMAGAQFYGAGKQAGMWGGTPQPTVTPGMGTMTGVQGSQMQNKNPWASMGGGMYA